MLFRSVSQSRYQHSIWKLEVGLDNPVNNEHCIDGTNLKCAISNRHNFHTGNTAQFFIADNPKSSKCPSKEVIKDKLEAIAKETGNTITYEAVRGGEMAKFTHKFLNEENFDKEQITEIVVGTVRGW